MNKHAKDNQKYLVLIDLDGTFLDDNDNIGKINRDAINKLILNGHSVAFLTGRSWNNSKLFFNDLNLDVILGNYNGALIHKPLDQNFEILQDAIDANIYDKLQIKIKEETEIVYEHHDDSMNVFLNTEFSDIETYKTNKKIFTENKIGVKFISWENKIKTNIYEGMFAFKDYENVKKAYQIMQKEFSENANFFLWKPWKKYPEYGLQISPNSGTKGQALVKIKELLNINQENIIAFGDNVNDVDMFDKAEISVAMLNSHDEIKEQAKFVTKFDNNNSGVGHFINDFFEFD